MIHPFVIGKREVAHAHQAAATILRNVSDVEDAAQQALLKAWRWRESFTGEVQCSTWIYKIARRTALDMVKKSRTQALVCNATRDVASHTPSCEARYAAREVLALTSQRMTVMKPAVARTIELRAQGMRVNQMAETEGVSVGTMYRRWQTALERIRVATRQTSSK